jgi:tetratricopeptide (TPR) repeat protein
VASADARELIHRAVAALQRNAWDEAAELAHAVLERFGPEANSLMVLASVRVQAGDPRGAIELYERARRLMPRHIHVLVNLASLYRAAGDLVQARGALEAALQVDPAFAVAHNNLGNILLDLGQRAEAARCYERASALDPNYPDPKAGLGRIAADEHRLDEARALAEGALQLAPHQAIAALTLAQVKLRQGDAAGAAGMLEVLLRDASLSVTNRAVAQGYLGEAYQALARYPAAFAAFSEANALRRGQYAAMPELERGPLAPASIARLTTFVENSDTRAWRRAPPAAATPAFMIGFPRSGTTLLEQVLGSHPDITTLEERDTLVDAASELLSGADAFARWPDLEDRQIERLRELYWQRVTTARLSAPATRVFIDKQPLNAVLLPLIQRLFPAAKIILVLRDPRDVVLSCYQQRFAMNVAMFQLLRLDTACAYYDTVMRLVEVSRRKLPLRLYTVKYEDLIATFDQTVRGLLGFLELEWSERVAHYAETARQRTIATPSAAQVVRPLYTDARGKWLRYREFLEPCLPVLEPWVRRFGYQSPADPTP